MVDECKPLPRGIRGCTLMRRHQRGRHARRLERLAVAVPRPRIKARLVVVRACTRERKRDRERGRVELRLVGWGSASECTTLHHKSESGSCKCRDESWAATCLRRERRRGGRLQYRARACCADAVAAARWTAAAGTAPSELTT